MEHSRWWVHGGRGPAAVTLGLLVLAVACAHGRPAPGADLTGRWEGAGTQDFASGPEGLTWKGPGDGRIALEFVLDLVHRDGNLTGTLEQHVGDSTVEFDVTGKFDEGRVRMTFKAIDIPFETDSLYFVGQATVNDRLVGAIQHGRVPSRSRFVQGFPIRLVFSRVSSNGGSAEASRPPHLSPRFLPRDSELAPGKAPRAREGQK